MTFCKNKLSLWPWQSVSLSEAPTPVRRNQAFFHAASTAGGDESLSVSVRRSVRHTHTHTHTTSPARTTEANGVSLQSITRFVDLLPASTRQACRPPWFLLLFPQVYFPEVGSSSPFEGWGSSFFPSRALRLLGKTSRFIPPSGPPSTIYFSTGTKKNDFKHIF